MARKKPTWILKAPRVVLVLIFPITTFILFLTLTIGCLSPALTAISPLLVTSTTPLSVGGAPTLLDIRIGFLSICFGPPPYTCIGTLPAPSPSSLATTTTNPQRNTVAATNPQRTTTTTTKPTPALLALALALQSVLAPLSLLPPLILLSLALLANLISIYFNIYTSRASHMRASLFARALDCAAAASVSVSFFAFRATTTATERLVRVATGASGLNIRGGSTAGGVFAATVGVAVAGAVINTVLTAGDAGGYAKRAEEGEEGEDDGGLLTSLEIREGGGGEKFKGIMERRRAAYSVMYT
ncbi:hypothetical protein B0T18DRAFT_423735 [Schizothecium vesticola]|uniref:Uncharacterized protein n=1 Tax=Schizothecium vesticola TaxID=314040 RepID=A0AA40F8D4_9PEZI|nr:hypothetical protein B0T18DRAFT_423735 [Schizothecium vesticola]